MSIALRYAARSDLGLGSKARNEDSAYASPDLLILADGMGGHAAGDVASSTVVAHLLELDDDSHGADDVLRDLGDSVAGANARLTDYMTANADLDGMGTTLIALVRSGDMLALANIGDSRAYLLRDGTFTQITKDHSFVQSLLDEGRITADQAVHHPQRSLVTRVLTGRPDDEPDLSLREAKVGDRYLLCSDGLSDYVAGSTIEEIVRTADTVEEAADRLIEIALRASTRDNVTVVVADVVEGDDDSATQDPTVVGAAATRTVGDPSSPEPRTPAEKAAALRRSLSDPLPEQEATDELELAEQSRRPRWLRWSVVAAVVAAVLGLATYFGYAWTQQQYYVGSADGNVAIFQGVSQDIGPIRLHSVKERTDIALTDLPSAFRQQVNDTIYASSSEDAQQIVTNLRVQQAACQSNPLGCS
ncbi:protein phosphatase [Branchiibius hedensis]|uniref:Protein phosphatase n=1 Tax=Branchiibius hedensis TaxID=672460 RepID=A0A2Y8ZX78_9MICO|nr:protein phosphatase 2C domain-containing protein [Branchiibius hedensis]PWJ27087.1 protein phosphatase [Branchiibius hedensis]SSA35898.1 protein phosphatase [Branchiibius hedensis]